MDFNQYEELLIPYLEFKFQIIALCVSIEAVRVGGGIFRRLEQKFGERQYVGLALQNLVLRDASCYLGEVGKLDFQGEGAAFELAAFYAGKQLQDGVIELYDDGRGSVYIL